MTMKFDLELIRKNRFLKWTITAMAAYKVIVFIFFAVPAIWIEPIPLENKLVALGISAFISWAFVYVALQFWKK